MEGRKAYEQPMYIYKRMEELIPEDHFLRKVDKVLDFGFVRELVKGLYSRDKGRPSIDPVVAVKIWLIGYFYGISSERRLIEDIKVNIAYRWFIGYTLEEEIPEHSSLTRIRDRFGLEKFQEIFDEVLKQCREKGLVSGNHLNVDATLVRADASTDSMQRIEDFAKDIFAKNPLQEEKKKEEKGEEKKENKSKRHYFSNKTHRSKTDPDATLMKKQNRGKSQLSYQCHMTVDSERRVVTGVKATTGAINEGPCLPEIVEEQIEKYGFPVKDLCADKAYSSTDNYVTLYRLGVKAYIPVGKKYNPKGRGGYGPEKFTYNRRRHVLICPTGKVLHPQPKQKYKYSLNFISSSRDCRICHLEKECKTNKLHHKMLLFNVKQYLKDWAEKRCGTKYGRKRRKERYTTVETIFGEGKTQPGLARAHFRGLGKVNIQFLMTAVAMNIKRIVTYQEGASSALVGACRVVIICIYRLLAATGRSRRRFAFAESVT